MNLDPIASVLTGTDSDQRSLNVDIGLAAAQFAVGDDAALDLYAVPAVFEVRHMDFGFRTQTQQVRVVKLHLGSGAGSGGDRVALDQRGIDLGLHPIARLSSAKGDITIRKADAGDTQSGLVLLSPTGGRQQQGQCDYRQDPICVFHGVSPALIGAIGMPKCKLLM